MSPEAVTLDIEIPTIQNCTGGGGTWMNDCHATEPKMMQKIVKWQWTYYLSIPIEHSTRHKATSIVCRRG